MRTEGAFEEAWDLLEIARRAEIEVSSALENSRLTDCEITDGMTAEWFLVRSFPGDDARALRWLARRRFGAFRPMQQKRAGRNKEHIVQGWEPIFPGWLFVYCWDIGKMKTRIETCPGVMSLLCYADSARPVPIPQDFIDRLRAQASVYDDRAPVKVGTQRSGNVEVRSTRHERRIRRLSRTERKELQRLTDTAKRVGAVDDETWDSVKQLDPGKRIAWLKRTLMSPAVAGCLRA